MPEYWEGQGPKTQLQVGTSWPKGGGAAFAGSPQGWVLSPYVSWAWHCADFSKVGGLYTAGLNSCSALVYLFGPQGKTVSHGALWHVNCSTYKAEHAPAEALRAIGDDSLELKYVVIGYNQVTSGVTLATEVQGCITEFRSFLEKYKVALDPWIYVGNTSSFGVSKDCFVGQPGKLISDAVSPRRQSIAVTMANASESQLQQTPAGCCSRCYITTAVCHSLGMDDDCAELQALRAYRDEILLRSDDGRKDVARYYATAPAIVARINATPDAGSVYSELYRADIVPALQAIADSDHAKANAIYRAMFERLQARYS